MNDPVPRIESIGPVHMMPGNVLIRVRNIAGNETFRNRQNLIQGQVIYVADDDQTAKNVAGASNSKATPPKPNINALMKHGDTVLFHGRNSYPVDVTEGQLRVFVVKVCDVAVKMGEPRAILR